MKKIFPLFLLVVTICIVWSCRAKEVIITSRSYYPKVEDYECIAKLDYMNFYLDQEPILLNSTQIKEHNIILPKYSLGDSVFEEYCTAAIEYPEAAAANGKYGFVFILFGIKEDGNVDSVRVRRGIFPIADSVALEVVKNQPPKMWIPAHREDGSFIYSEIAVRFNFRRKPGR